MTDRLYWTGNSAKTKILADMLGKLPTGRQTLVFDYGCGGGGDWPEVLRDYPQIRLIGYEPHAESFARAKAALQGLNAELYTGEEIADLDFKADFIVSFSVLEHVYDRNFYLRTARKLLGDEGIFYLNYDDGHFRNCLDLNRPPLWFGQLKEWLHNLLAGPLSRVGLTDRYQRRVPSVELLEQVRETGFSVERSEYSNLVSFKRLQKTMPDDLRQEYSRLWLQVEERLNGSFLLRGDAVMGDNANLWLEMGSITLFLKPADLRNQDIARGH